MDSAQITDFLGGLLDGPKDVAVQAAIYLGALYVSFLLMKAGVRKGASVAISGIKSLYGVRFGASTIAGMISGASLLGANISSSPSLLPIGQYGDLNGAYYGVTAALLAYGILGAAYEEYKQEEAKKKDVA